MTPRWFAIVMLLSAGSAAGADLGRMFFTPAQRATLDNARKQNIRVEVGSENEQAAPVPQNVSVNGLVRRSDGKSTVWLNNRAISDQHAAGLNVTTVKNDNRVKLSVPESGRSVDLKVGQTVEILSGTIEEGYSRRTTLKSEAKPPAGTENNATGVPNVTPPSPSPAIKSSVTGERRSSRAAERDAQDDFRSNRGLEPKR